MRGLNEDEVAIITDFAAFTERETMVLERIHHACKTPKTDRQFSPHDLMLEHEYEESLELNRTESGMILVCDLRNYLCYYHEAFSGDTNLYDHILRVWWSIWRLLDEKNVTFDAVVTDLPAFGVDRISVDHPVAEIRRILMDMSYVPPTIQPPTPPKAVLKRLVNEYWADYRSVNEYWTDYRNSKMITAMKNLRLISETESKLIPAFCAQQEDECKCCAAHGLVNAAGLCYACFFCIKP